MVADGDELASGLIFISCFYSIRVSCPLLPAIVMQCPGWGVGSQNNRTHCSGRHWSSGQAPGVKLGWLGVPEKCSPPPQCLQADR